MNSPPRSISPPPGSSCDQTRPPTRSRASRTITSRPAPASRSAAASPAKPAPTTAIRRARVVGSGPAMPRRYPARSMAGSSKPEATVADGRLEAARAGDETAFTALVEPYRGELIAHCYRMMGSFHDAEDVLQETMLRAWRGIGGFEGRSSLRSWLYTIATNTALNAIEKRKPRVHPVDYGPRTDPAEGVPGMPVAESVWIEPFPDEKLIVYDGPMAPEARYEAREAVELAFIAALQHLP